MVGNMNTCCEINIPGEKPIIKYVIYVTCTPKLRTKVGFLLLLMGMKLKFFRIRMNSQDVAITLS